MGIKLLKIIKKDFGNYQMPMKLFEDLREGEISIKKSRKVQFRVE